MAQTPVAGYRPEVDGLRGIAVALVVVYHVGDVLWPARRTMLLPGGALGVDLFFVLSGFLITSLLLAERDRRARIDLAAFARRRGLRLLPGMLVLFAVVLVIAVAVDGWYDVGEVLSTAGWSFGFAGNWAVGAGKPYVVGHLWSVSIEGQFYLVWALVVAAAVRFRHALVLLAGVALAIVVAVASYRHVDVGSGGNVFYLYASTAARLDAPLVGALAGIAMAAGLFDRLRGRAAAAVAVVGLAVLLTAAVLLAPYDRVLYRGLFTVVALAAAAALVGAVQAPETWPVRLLSTRLLVRLGTLSYSLYLWHLPIFQWMARLAPGWRSSLRAGVAVLAALAAAALSYRFVERPLVGRRGAAAAPAATDITTPAAPETPTAILAAAADVGAVAAGTAPGAPETRTATLADAVAAGTARATVPLPAVSTATQPPAIEPKAAPA